MIFFCDWLIKCCTSKIYECILTHRTILFSDKCKTQIMGNYIFLKTGIITIILQLFYTTYVEKMVYV